MQARNPPKFSKDVTWCALALVALLVTCGAAFAAQPKSDSTAVATIQADTIMASATAEITATLAPTFDDTGQAAVTQQTATAKAPDDIGQATVVQNGFNVTAETNEVAKFASGAKRGFDSAQQSRK